MEQYPSQYMDSWQRFHETPFPDRKKLFSNLTMKNITDADHKHTKRVSEDLKIKNKLTQKVY